MKVSRDKEELRSTGLDVIGDTPWGTHFCNFFETKQDLLDILIPYFKAGVENNEFCLWITADPITIGDASQALQKAVPDFDKYIQNKSIEILPHYNWYLKDGALDGAGVMRGWHKKLEDALTRGYSGMRVSGNAAWLDREMWKDFVEYERELNSHIAGMPIILLCTYPLAQCSAGDVLEVARAHKLAISKRVGRWEIMETPEIKKAQIKKLEERTIQLEVREELFRQLVIKDRVEAENKLQESERNLDALINCSPDPVWLIDTELRLVVANEAFFEQVKNYNGVSLQAGDHVLFASMSEGLRQNWKRLFDRAFKGERITIEYPDGDGLSSAHSFYDITINPVYNESREVVGIGCYTQDVTERKKVGDLIRKSQSELAEAQKLAQYGNWNFDLVTGRITWSEELYNIFGTDNKTFLATQDSFMNLVDEEDRELIRETGLRSQTYGTSFDLEYRIITSSGERRIIHEVGYAGCDADGKIVRLFGTAQNITARKRAEEAMKESERKYKNLFENNPLPMFILGFEALLIIDCNEEALIKYGYSRDEFLRLTLADISAVEDIPLMKEILKSEEVYGTIHKKVWRHKKKNGELMFVEVSTQLIDYHGKGSSLVMLNDVTEKLKTEEEIKSSYQQLQELTAHLQHIREEERTRIAREIHDELGQQLTGLKMDASWIGKKITTEDKSIQEKLSNMISLIDETVKTVRRISSELRPGILDDLGLMAALEWQGQEFEKRTGIKSQFRTDLTDLDPEGNLSTNIFRVYQEALTNIARHAYATKVETELEQKNNHIRLIIKDNGQGFDLNEVKTKNSLGLLGMKERALMLHGELTIESNKPNGTVVILKVPLLTGPDKVLL